MDDREGGVQSAVTLVGCSASRVLSVGWVRPGEGGFLQGWGGSQTAVRGEERERFQSASSMW